MLPKKIAFVDLETTGGRAHFDRIIEIGIVRVEDNKIVKTYNTLLDPQAYLPKEIEMLTGITAADLEGKPTFRQVIDDVREMIDDCIFVAHNVRFDYGFLKSELKRHNITFQAKHFCTVRLSRFLYPMYPRHNLDALIERFNFECKNRHRALDDAMVLYNFYDRIQKEFSSEALDDAINKTMKKPSLPLKLEVAELDKLPEHPGVYIFYGENGMPLYVGKSINIKNRVLDHFSSDIHSPTEMKISQQIESIETIKTAGELGALFLESQLIKKMLPLYNKRSRIKKELVAVRSLINKDGYQECYLEPITVIKPDELGNFLGFFKSKKQAKNFLSTIAQKYSLCEKLLGLEKTSGACFAHRLARCSGACVGKVKPIIYNLKLMTAFTTSKVKSWPFSGPIIIEEKEVTGNTEYFLVDNWCYIGRTVVDAEGNMKIDRVDDYSFDLDVYQILRQFLKKNTNEKKIRIVSKEQQLSFFDKTPILNNQEISSFLNS